MITIDWTIIRKSVKLDMENDLENCYAEIEALELEKTQLAKTNQELAKPLDALRVKYEEMITINGRLNAGLDTKDQQIAELEKEVLALQKTSFAELPKPVPPKGGRSRKAATPEERRNEFLHTHLPY